MFSSHSSAKGDREARVSGGVHACRGRGPGILPRAPSRGLPALSPGPASLMVAWTPTVQSHPIAREGVGAFSKLKPCPRVFVQRRPRGGRGEPLLVSVSLSSIKTPSEYSFEAEIVSCGSQTENKLFFYAP